LELALHFGDYLARSVTNAYCTDEIELFVFYHIASPLAAFGLVEHGKSPTNAKWQRLKLSKEGTRFMAKAKIRVEQNRSAAGSKPAPVPVSNETDAKRNSSGKKEKATKRKPKKQ
jgi:hypothetical protein